MYRCMTVIRVLSRTKANGVYCICTYVYIERMHIYIYLTVMKRMSQAKANGMKCICTYE